MGAHQQEANTNDRKPLDKCDKIYIVALTLVMYLLLGLCILLARADDGPPLPTCHVDSVILHPFNVSSSQITAYWNTSFLFSVSKGGWLSDPVSSFYLHDVQASVFYKDKHLCSAAIRPIYANFDYQVEAKANMGVSSAYLNTSIGDAMASDWSLGAINFNIKVNALVSSGKKHSSIMSFSCEDVPIGFADGKNSAGTMIGGSRNCRRD